MTSRLPGIGATLGRALDLSVTASRHIRQVSIYIGLLGLAIFGPAVVLGLLFARDLGGIDAMVDTFLDPEGVLGVRTIRVLTMLALSGSLAFLGYALIAIEGQILAVTVIGASATGRTMGLVRSLALSRRVFWSVLVALLIVAIPQRIADTVVVEVMAPRTEASLQVASFVQVAVDALVNAPFAFTLAGIVLGGVGPIEAIRRSTRIARARWRLAIVVASVGSVVGIVALFALSAGLDLLGRVGIGLGLSLDGSPSAAIMTGFVVLTALLAIGSLSVTIAALTAAPQVVAFLAMTGYSAGLDRALEQAPPTVSGSEVPGGATPPTLLAWGAEPFTKPPRTRLVTRPMIALIVAAGILAVIGIASI